MKKLTLLTCLVLYSALTQAIDFDKLRFSLVGGLDFTKLTANAESIAALSHNSGFHFGVETDYFFANNYAFNSGLQMSYANPSLRYQKGTMMDERFTFNNTDLEYHINYLKIPLGLKFLSSDIGKWNIYAHLGIQYQIRLSAEGTTTGGKMKDAQKENQERHIRELKITKEVNPGNFLYYIGAGTEYYFVGKTAIRFGLRYEHGLMNTIISQGKEDSDSQIRSISTLVGIIF